MHKILVQQSQSTLYEKALKLLKDRFEPIIAPDDALGEALSKNKNEITAIVVFELSELSLKLCELARNERFSDPTIPIAYLGFESSRFPMPFGAARFDENSIESFIDFIQTQIKIKALVVEDDDALREITSLTLSKVMVVENASNGDDAYQMLQKDVYDLVVLDVMLPGKNGEQLFNHIRENAPLTAVVIITAFDTDERELNFSFKGVAGYIKKPFESNKIFRQQVMDAIIKHHDQNESTRLAHAQNERSRALQKHRDQMNRYS